MKNKLLFIVILIVGLLTSQAQRTSVTTSMGADYANKVYYKLDTGTEHSFVANSWDIAFLRTSSYEMSIRENTHSGIQVFEASNSISDWDSIAVENEASWIALQSDNTDWNGGAFQFGSATYGWGEYNPANHHVTGSVIFVLKYPDGTYIKFINEDFYAGYSFKYAIWNGSSWSTDYEASVMNTDNPDNVFNYYSFINHEAVIAEPATTDWDFVFTKYFVDYGGTMYPVVGVLQNQACSVAENDETEPIGDISGLVYTSEKNTIGHDWKTYTGSEYEVHSNHVFYIKYEDDSIYRLFFTGYEGGSTGTIEFQYDNVADLTGTEDYHDLSFTIYPNPSNNGLITLLYETTSEQNEIKIVNSLGKIIKQSTWKTNSGFHSRILDLSNLNSGIYSVIYTSNNRSITKKIILQ